MEILAEVSDHRIHVSKAWNWLVFSHISGRIAGLANKVFGNLIYDQTMSKCDFNYQAVKLTLCAGSIDPDDRKTVLEKDRY